MYTLVLVAGYYVTVQQPGKDFSVKLIDFQIKCFGEKSDNFSSNESISKTIKQHLYPVLHYGLVHRDQRRICVHL